MAVLGKTKAKKHNFMSFCYYSMPLFSAFASLESNFIGSTIFSGEFMDFWGVGDS